MEVVSPITFAHSNGGSKRRFACADVATTSPAGFAPSSPHHHSADENMDDCSSGYGFHATKRRRKNNQECAGSALLQKENNWSISPFLSGTAALSQPGSQSPISAGKFVGFVVFVTSIIICYFYLSVISFSHRFLCPSFSKQTNSDHLPSAQFRIIHATTTSTQSRPSKDSGATTSCSATSRRNRPPQIRERIPPDTEPKGRK
jgi:hypothetical protein